MAIQTRRGNYIDFDPDKMLPGEWGTALADDPSAKDGTAVYMCFAPGNTKRMATYEDMQENIKTVTKEITEEVSEQIIVESEAGINRAIENADRAALYAEGVAGDVQKKLDNGEFIGPEGPRGPAGSIAGLSQEPVEFKDYPQQENLTSGDTVADLFGKISTFMKTMEEGGMMGGLIDKVYPVGSIYMSASPTDPATLFGGTWSRWGQGKVPVGVDAKQPEFNTVEQIGGEKTHLLTTGELAAHTHSQEPHTHLQDAHTHSLNNHTHSFSANTNTTGNHTHTGRYKAMNSNSLAGGSFLIRRIANEDPYDGITQLTDGAGNHSHTVSGTTGQSAGNSGAALTVNTETTAVNQNTGSSMPHNNLQPYITCYMWKRTA